MSNETSGSAGFPIRFKGVAQVISVPREHWHELDYLSREGDPDSQAALNRFLKKVGWPSDRIRSYNLITDVGLNVAGALIFPASKWFIFPKGAGAVANANTMASHAAWSELTTYTQATRPALTMGSWSAGVASNASAVASFTAPAGGLTFNGWGVVDNSTKGAATPGNLISVADHSAPQNVAGGSALQQTLTATVARGP